MVLDLNVKNDRHHDRHETIFKKSFIVLSG